jgi:hypothetical protein
MLKAACAPIALWGGAHLLRTATHFRARPAVSPRTALDVYELFIGAALCVALATGAAVLARLWPLLRLRGKVFVVLSTPAVFGVCYLALR